MFYCETDLLIAQLISVGVAIVLAVVGSTILFKIVDSISTLRADADEEINGLDLVEHGERGYTIGLFTGAPSFFGSNAAEAERSDLKWINE